VGRNFPVSEFRETRRVGPREGAGLENLAHPEAGFGRIPCISPVLCQNSADRLSSLPVIVVQDPCAFSRSAGRRLFGVSRERARSLRCLSLGVARDAPRPHLREAYRELDSGSGIPARWQKFPCSRTQGIRRLGPRERAGLETICLAGSRDLDNFPVFSLWIRDSGRETGSR
jgi:hypothetical protein